MRRLGSSERGALSKIGLDVVFQSECYGAFGLALSTQVACNSRPQRWLDRPVRLLSETSVLSSGASARLLQTSGRLLLDCVAAGFAKSSPL